MTANITATVKLVNPQTTLPAGEYKATWIGYAICSDDARWPADVSLETVEGIRDVLAVLVTVDDHGTATVYE